jgi:succinate dehydrogenase / fumarate reductase, cytochrome b subunit
MGRSGSVLQLRRAPAMEHPAGAGARIEPVRALRWFDRGGRRLHAVDLAPMEIIVSRGYEPSPLRNSAMARADRPLSPHLQIYRWYFTMALSIAHRITGLGLALGLLLLTWWLLALASGPEAFATVHGLMDSWFGALILFLYTLTLFYHMGNGIRHLVWDFGYGFDPQVARASGAAVLAFAGGMTVLTWLTIALAG